MAYWSAVTFRRVAGAGPTVTLKTEMRKPDIARRMARQAGVSQGEAADRLDRVVHEILSSLRKGREAPLPGLGKFRQGPNGEVTFEREGGKLRD